MAVDKKNQELNLFIILNLLALFLIAGTVFSIHLSNFFNTRRAIIIRLQRIENPKILTRLRNFQKSNTNRTQHPSISGSVGKIELFPKNSAEYEKYNNKFDNIKKLNFENPEKNIFKQNRTLHIAGFVNLNNRKFLLYGQGPIPKVSVNPMLIFFLIIITNIFIYIIVIYVKKIYKKEEIPAVYSQNEKLAASIAHELKNPLSGISMFVELLERKIKKEPEIDYIFNIKKQIRNLNKIITNFINYARPFKVNFQKCNLEKLLSETFDNFEDELDETTLIREIEKNSEISADPVLIKQVFLNILLNALDAIKNKKEGQIKVSFFMKNSNQFIEFENNGEPVPVDEKEKIFKPYFTTKIKGSGLGLAISKKIMTEHGGDIKLTTSDAEKTVFQLEFKN
ncbi:MAG: sensor histidine kinase [Candidatus Muiribacteriota bacterium]